jgi:hypothetical protein
LPPGESFEFIIEAEKLEKVRRVVAHNGGKIIEESRSGEDFQVRVSKNNVPESY